MCLVCHYCSQGAWIQLTTASQWDYACNFLMLGNWKGALDCFSILKNESNWSRAVYT
jgi:hypothetical protein